MYPRPTIPAVLTAVSQSFHRCNILVFTLYSCAALRFTEDLYYMKGSLTALVVGNITKYEIQLYKGWLHVGRQSDPYQIDD